MSRSSVKRPFVLAVIFPHHLMFSREAFMPVFCEAVLQKVRKLPRGNMAWGCNANGIKGKNFLQKSVFQHKLNKVLKFFNVSTIIFRLVLNVDATNTLNVA